MNGVAALPSWIVILSAILTPSVAIGAAIVASLQWITAEKKRRLDLFDKRYNLFKRYEGLLISVALMDRDRKADRMAFISTIDELPFLFGTWVLPYRESVLASFFKLAGAIDAVPTDFDENASLEAKKKEAKEKLAGFVNTLMHDFFKDMKVGD